MELFREASSLPPEEVETFVETQTADDEAMRLELRDLLQLSAKEELPLDAADLPLSAFEDIEESLREVSEPATPTQIDGHNILRRLGEGGMGTVFLARQDNPERLVALKIVRSSFLTTDLLARFRHETRVLGRLQHPGIATIYGAGFADLESGIGVTTTPYISMEYIDGATLSEHVEQASLDLRARLELFVAICDAVEHAHECGVIHRDLKPANILVTHEGRPKVLDFGLARAMEKDLHAASLQTRTGQILGTVPFMSPEQIAGDPSRLDQRTDVYALGVILFQLLTGRLPFEVVNLPLPEAVRIIETREPPRPSATESRFTGDLDTIALTALEKDPDRRYPSAMALARDVQRHLRDETIHARPASNIYRLKKYARRNRGLVTGFAVASVVLVVGAITSLIFALEASQNAEEATRNFHQVAALKEDVDFRLAVANLAQAQRHLEDLDQSMALVRLNEVPEASRAWEWSFLRAQIARFEIADDSGGSSRAVSRQAVAAYDSEGRPVSAGIISGVPHAINLHTGEPGRRFGHETVNRIRLSRGGACLASLSSDAKTVGVFDFGTGTQLLELKPRGDVRDIVLSGDGSRLAICAIGRFDFYEVRGGKRLFSVTTDPKTTRTFTVNHDGSRVVMRPRMGLLQVREGETGRVLAEREVPEGYLGLTWSSDCRQLGVLRNPPHAATILDSESLEERGRIEFDARVRGGGEWSYGSALLRDGLYLTADPNERARLWTIGDGTLQRSYSLPDPIFRIRVNSAEDTAGFVGRRWVQFDDLEGGGARVLPASETYLYAARFSPDGELVATGGWDHRIRVFDTATGELLRVLATGTDSEKPDRQLLNFVDELAFSPDGTQLEAWVGRRLRFDLINSEVTELEGDLLAHLRQLPAGSRGQQYCVSPSGGLLFDARGSGPCRVYERGQDGWRPGPDHGAQAHSLAVSPDEALLVTSDWEGGTIRLWDLATNRELKRLDTGLSRVLSLEFSPDGRRLFGGGTDGLVHVWRVPDLVPVLRLSGHRSYIRALRFSPDGRQLASASGDGTLQLRDSRNVIERQEVKARRRQSRQEMRARNPEIDSITGAEARQLWEEVSKSLATSGERSALRALLIRE